MPASNTAMRKFAEADPEAIAAGAGPLRETPNGVWSRISALEGELVIETPHDGKRHRLTAGESLALMPRQAHRLHATAESRVRYEFSF